MPTESKRYQTLLSWGLVFSVWTGLALLFSGPDFIQALQNNHRSAAWCVIAAELHYSYLWLALTPFVVWWGRLFRIQGDKKLRTMAIHLATSGVLVFVHAALYLLFSISLGWYCKIAPFEGRYTLIIKTFAPSTVVFYWGILVVNHAIDYYRRYQERELRTSELKAQLVKAELQVLKMQLHPHFLFNTLNTISALIHESPEEADEMITQLGDLLRMTLETAGVQETPLAQELDFLKHYLAIEQTRFHDRLSISMTIEPETLDARVPSLIMQPLVENAIRHGIASRPEARSIQIKSWRDRDRLCLRVTDDGPGLRSDKLPLKEGVGLANTRQRLQNLYGANHDFSLRNSTLGGLVVELAVPFNIAEVLS